jgi:hypothetical protein
MGTKKKKTKRSAKLNGQEYLPPYQFWHEKDFWNDEHVSRGMNFTQRHRYRALLQSAFFCSTRPYLPDDDDLLWKLADAGTKQNWLENKEPILVKFQKIDKGGKTLLNHKRLMRDWIKLLENSEKQSARRRGKSDEEDEEPHSAVEPTITDDQEDGIGGDESEV